MSKKQNIIIWYISLAIIISISIGFTTEELERLNHTTFILLLISIVGITAVVTTRGDGGIDFIDFNRYVSPLIILVFYLIIAVGLCMYKTQVYDVEDLTADEISELDGGASVRSDYLFVTIKNENKFHIKSIVISATITPKSGVEAPRKTFSLFCSPKMGEEEDSCMTPTTLRRDSNYEKLNWSIISAKVKPVINHPTKYEIAALVLLFIYVPIGIVIVLLTSARETIEDKGVNNAVWTKRFIFYTVVYIGGILMWPLFLNSWFSKANDAKEDLKHYKKPAKTALDDFIKATYGNSKQKKKANLLEAANLAYESLLDKRVGKEKVIEQTAELIDSTITYSTHDLALCVALFFYRKTELKDDLAEAQLIARMNLMKWLETNDVNRIVASTFEDNLYDLYKR